jgi:hypothetical protein
VRRVRFRAARALVDHLLERLGNGLAPHLGRLLMQQEKHHNCIVAAVFEVQIGGVLQRGIDMLRVAQLGLQVLDLDRVPHQSHPPDHRWAEPTHQMFGKVPVDTGDLQHTTVDDLPHLLQCRIPQPGKVPPQNQVNQPLALENMDRPGVQIGPPIGVVQVFRDDCWGPELRDPASGASRPERGLRLVLDSQMDLKSFPQAHRSRIGSRDAGQPNSDAQQVQSRQARTNRRNQIDHDCNQTILAQAEVVHGNAQTVCSMPQEQGDDTEQE